MLIAHVQSQRDRVGLAPGAAQFQAEEVGRGEVGEWLSHARTVAAPLSQFLAHLPLSCSQSIHTPIQIWRSFVIMALMILCVPLKAQPLPKGGVWLTAREQSETAKEWYRYRNDYGSRIVERWGARELYVKLRRSMRGDPTVGLETIFLVGVQPGYQVVEHRRRIISLPESRDLELTVLCGYEHTETRLRLIGEYDFEGTPKPTAWAIRIWSGGQIIAEQGSLPEVLAWVSAARLQPPPPESGKVRQKSP